VPDPAAVTPTHIRAYLIGLEKRGLKNTTVHAHARSIRVWYNWMVAEGDVQISPMKNVKMPKMEKRLPVVITLENVKKVLDACPKTPIGLRDRALLMSLLDSGMRATEFLSVRVGDLDMKTGIIRVHGKGHKERVVCLGAKARVAIVRYMKTRPEVQPHDPLWIAYDLQGQTTDGLRYEGLRQLLRRLTLKTGVKLSAHTFRRTFATWASTQHMDVFSLQRLLGHADVSTTRIYVDQNEAALTESHRLFGPVDHML
jgi:integrase/recombinase XerC/integrase/recombinase XerD